MLPVIILVSSFISGIVSGWDSISNIGFEKLLMAKKLEFICIMIMLDIGKGVMFYFYLISHNDLSWLVIPVGLLILIGTSIRYYYAKNLAYYLMLLGFIWPMYPQIINTTVALTAILLFLIKNDTWVKKTFNAY